MTQDHEELVSHSSMLLEVVLSVCLYYIKSYYPSLPGLTKEEVLGNREVQLAGVITLSWWYLLKKMERLLLCLCKVQKVVLHNLLSGVHSLANMNMGEGGFTKELLKFNEMEGLDDMSANTEAFK